MRDVKRYFYNAILLSISALIMRSVAVAFNVYVTEKVGAEGMGILTLVGSAYGFAVTFATSGVSLAVTRLVAETVVTAPQREASRRLANVALVTALYSAVFGGLAGAVLFFGADYIGTSLLGDERTVASLRIFAVTLPCSALASALAGYFNACRRVSKNAVTQVSGQALKIAATVSALSFFAPSGLEPMLAVVSAGGAVAEVGSFVIAFCLYVADRHKNYPKKSSNVEQTCSKASTELCADTKTDAAGSLLSTALPLALSSYIRSGLVTLEHILIPRGLRKSGSSYSAALASYGVLHGMVMPVVLFPYAVLGSFTSLLVPELSICRAKRENERIRHIARLVFRSTLIFAVGTAVIMAAFSNELGLALYDSEEAGDYLLMLSPIIPVMYLDTAADSMLKGLGHQLFCMRVNIADALISVVLVWLLVPMWGVKGYAAVIVVSELINAALSIWKLVSVTGMRAEFAKWLIRPLASATFASAAVKYVSVSCTDGVGVALVVVGTTALYAVFLVASGAVTVTDVGYIAGIFGKEKAKTEKKARMTQKA